MSESHAFQPERWSLFIELDPPVEGEPDERRLLRRHILKTFGGLPEEYDEVVRVHDDGRWEIASPYLDWPASVMDWITSWCIPRELRLVRNEERLT